MDANFAFSRTSHFEIQPAGVREEISAISLRQRLLARTL